MASSRIPVQSELELESGGGDLVGVSERMAEIAKRYHFFPSVRDPSFDFGGFRREVESLVNDPALSNAGDAKPQEFASQGAER